MRLPGKNEPDGVGLRGARVPKQRRAVHAAHSHVARDDVGAFAAEPVNRGFAAVEKRELPWDALRPKGAAQRVDQPRLVVDEQDAERCGRRHAAISATLSGSRTTNVA